MEERDARQSDRKRKTLEEDFSAQPKKVKQQNEEVEHDEPEGFMEDKAPRDMGVTIDYTPTAENR